MSRKGKIATIGMFDGVHSGHRFLIDQLKQEGAKRDMETLVISFNNHPLAIIAPECAPAMLSTPREREKDILSIGVDHFVSLDFDNATQRLTAHDFMAMIHEKWNVEALILGFNNRFGCDRLNNIADYQNVGKQIGIDVLQAQELPNTSSSIIRNHILNKEITLTTEKLGHFYFIDGEVVKGKQLGRTIGFPTANIQPPVDKLIPPLGVYATQATMPNGQKYPAMVNIGCRPTVDKTNAPISIEANIFDFSENLYGQTLKIEFLDFVREEQKFNSLEELRNQINLDKISVQKIYNSIISNHP